MFSEGQAAERYMRLMAHLEMAVEKRSAGGGRKWYPTNLLGDAVGALDRSAEARTTYERALAIHP